MSKINALLVKELRVITGAGIMDCKKMLIETNGNIQLAIENMRKSGSIKAAKKIDNITAEGLVISKIEGKYGVILEVNCQTDFVAKGVIFQDFVNKVVDVILLNKINDIKTLRDFFEEERTMLINKIGENINIRRFSYLEGESLSSYQHGTRIAVLISVKGANKELAKKLAMHIAASKPEFIKPEEVSCDIIEKERKAQLSIAMQSGKSKEIVDKIVEGRVRKFINRISLTSQHFIMDPNKSIAQLLKECDVEVNHFIRFEVGEGIEKFDANSIAKYASISNHY